MNSGKLTIYFSVVGNVLLVAIKLFLGVIGRSQALITDAVHSITDLATDVMAYFGLIYSSKGEDHNHPFGHGKIDTLMSLLIGISMLLASFWLGFEAIITMVEGDYQSPTIWAVAGALLSILIKEILFQYTFAVGKKINSQALIANAWHHRGDVISSLAVLLGVLPAVFFPELAILDPIAATLVSLMIFKLGYDIVVPAFYSISDAAPSREAINGYKEIAESVEGVINAHDIRGRFYSNKIYLEIHIVVDPEITVTRGHSIAKEVKAVILSEHSDVLDIIIHVDPNDSSSTAFAHHKDF